MSNEKTPESLNPCAQVAIQTEFVQMLFNMGMVSGALMQEDIAKKLIASMNNGLEGERLSSHVKSLHKKLGLLIQAASMQDEPK